MKHTFIPTLFALIAIAIPMLQMVFSASGKCPPMKMIALNSCITSQKFSLDPQSNCDALFDNCGSGGCKTNIPQAQQGVKDPKILKGYDINSVNKNKNQLNADYQTCLCKGYTLLNLCMSQICPSDANNLQVIRESQSLSCGQGGVYNEFSNVDYTNLPANTNPNPYSRTNREYRIMIKSHILSWSSIAIVLLI